MSKITYLFGAGASCGALPIVNQIPKRIEALIELISQDEYKLEEIPFDSIPDRTETKNKLQNEFIEGLKWLQNQCLNHASVDTFAKKIYLTEGDSYRLKKMKLLLSCFFVYEQAANKPDNRYDAFYASILKSKHSFPEYIGIISWNYDYQFELSYSQYSGDKRLNANQSHLRVNHKFSCLFKPNAFCINKLNGTTGFFNHGWPNDLELFMNTFQEEVNKDLIETLIYFYAAIIDNPRLKSGFSFAWEKDDANPSIIEMAVESSKDTEILIVIGYSFPFFNRDVDRQIIGSMKNLRKVYFQAPDAENLVERFQAIRDDIDPKFLIPKFDTEQFFLPNEF